MLAALLPVPAGPQILSATGRTTDSISNRQDHSFYQLSIANWNRQADGQADRQTEVSIESLRL